jgi:flagellar basal body P-ring formation protein FlgA
MKAPIMRKFCLSLICLSAPLSAEPFEDITALDAQVAAITKAAAPIDRRLKLARCPEGVMIDPPALDAVALRCKSLGWRIRVALLQVEKAETVPSVIIRRGDAVELISSGSGFEVSTQGTAVEDGRLGKGIRVKSLTAAGIIVGTVTAEGKVIISR